MYRLQLAVQAVTQPTQLRQSQVCCAFEGTTNLDAD